MGRYGALPDNFVMSREMAELVKYLHGEKCESPIGPLHRATWRRLSEIICDKYPDLMDRDLRGNQLHGIELCEEAAKILGVSDEDYEKEWM